MVVFDFIQESADLKGEPFDEEKLIFICLIPRNINIPKMREFVIVPAIPPGTSNFLP